MIGFGWRGSLAAFFASMVTLATTIEIEMILWMSGRDLMQLTGDEEARVRKRAEEIVLEMTDLRRDIDWVYRDVVSKHYPVAHEGERYGFGYTCHAYVMLCFARIDGISTFWAGGKNWIYPGKHGPSQNKRMVAFLDKYFPRQTTTHRIAVELWRHTPMHEGIPRPVIATSGDQYRYVLEWYSDDPQRHYTLVPEPQTSGAGQPSHIFYLDVIRLVADLEHMVRSYADDLRAPSSDLLRKNYVAREKELSKAIEL
jgi:hypothetical protein